MDTKTGAGTGRNRCEHCGLPETAERLVYVGGHGYTPRRLCWDVPGCWTRWTANQGRGQRRSTEAA